MRMSLIATALLTAAAAWPAAAQTAPDPGASAPPSISGLPREHGGYGGGRGAAASPELRAARHAVREQCAADVVRLCPDAAVAPTAPPAVDGAEAPARRGGALFQCVRQHVGELSPGCRQALDAQRAARTSTPPTAPPPQG